MTKTTGRVHIYCRVSSVGQEDGYSLDTQEAACRTWAEQRGVTVASMAREVRSGGDRHRPELDAMLARIVQSDVVVCYALDRLSRSQVDTAILIDRIEGAGATLQLVTEDFEQSATGTFLRNAKAFVAELEREKIAERTQRGRRARVADGKPLVTKRPPYGYDWNGDKSAYVIDPATAPIVRMIFDAYLDGGTLRGVCAELEAHGIPSPTGRPQWTAAVIREILTRPIYSGTGVAFARVYTKRRTSKGYDHRPATDDERVMLPGIAPAIVTPEEHAAAHALLARNRTASRRNNRNPEAALLRAGFIRCGHCGWVMGVKNAPPSAPGRSAVYQCNSRSMRSHDCPQPRIAASIVDGAVWDRVCGVLRDPAMIERELGKHRNGGGLDRDLAAIDARLETNATRRTRLVRALADLDDDADIAEVKAQLRLLADTAKTLDADRADLMRRIADVDADRDRVRTLTDWCEHFGAKLAMATYEQKRMALEALGVSVRVFRVGATDDDGTTLPRWELTMRPLVTGDAIVYGDAHSATCARHWRPSRPRRGRRPSRW
jgi:site-specific DNA recombinase